MGSARRLDWDWYDGFVPDNVVVDDGYLETSFSFLLYRSSAPTGVRIGRGSAVYLGTMFDVGPQGCVSIGQFAILNGARIVCDARIEIGDYALISWNVVLMDSYRVPLDPERRRLALEAASRSDRRVLDSGETGQPIRIGRNVWIGFDSCVLPGVTIGEGAVVGARSVVAEDVEPYTVVAGNRARVVRRLEHAEG